MLWHWDHRPVFSTMRESEPLFAYVLPHYGPTVLYHTAWEKATKRLCFSTLWQWKGYIWHINRELNDTWTIKNNNIIRPRGFIGYNGLTDRELADSGIIKEVNTDLDSTEHSTQSSEANINVSRYECETLLIERVMLHIWLVYECVCVRENIDILYMNIYCWTALFMCLNWYIIISRYHASLLGICHQKHM